MEVQIHYYGNGVIIKTTNGVLRLGEDSSKRLLDYFETKTYDENDPLFIFLVGNNLLQSIYCAHTNITGEYGKYYPMKLILELSNYCNFNCTHCYAIAGRNNNVFMDINIIEDIVKYSGLIPNIVLTGGEPLTHPDIDKIISLLKDFNIQLLSNGTMVTKVNEKDISEINNIVISIYGISQDELHETTGATVSINYMDEQFRYLNKNNNNVHSNILIKRNMIGKLEKYVDYCYKKGFKSVKFGVATPIGRAFDNMETWLVTDKELDAIRNEIDSLSDEWESVIRVDTWTKPHFTYTDGFMKNIPFCGMGHYTLCVNYKGMIRSCQFVPESFNICDYDYFEQLIKTNKVDQNNLLREYVHSLSKEGKYPERQCEYIASIAHENTDSI